MMDFLGMTHNSQERKGGFDHHAVIPGSLFADFDVVRYTVGTAEAPVSQQDGFLSICLKEVQELVVSIVHFVPNPAADLTKPVENPTQFHAHTPAPFVLALGPKLLAGTPFPNRENQFYWIAIHHVQHARLFQQQVSQIFLLLHLARDVPAIWQATKQIGKVTLEPAIKRPTLPAFQRIQYPYRHHFTRVQLRARVFGYFPDAIVDMIKNVNDSIFRSHELRLSLASITKSLALFMTISTRTIGYKRSC